MVDFQARGNSHKPQDFTYRRVLNFINVSNLFHLGIHDPMFMFKKLGQIAASNIAVFVYSSAHYRSTIFFIPDWIVRPTAEK